MTSVIKEKDMIELESRLHLFPWYVLRFVDHKMPDLSPSSLLGYSYDYESFFSWLISECLTSAKNLFDIPLTDLEGLRTENIDAYKLFLRKETEQKKANKKASMDRKLSALKSLFHYLSQIAEDENLYPLLKRNVMAKVTISRSKPKILPKTKMLVDQELDEFIDYVAWGYAESIADNKQALHYYELNRIRDVAIVSLILNSGLRVSEVVNLNMDDLYIGDKEKLVHVHGKGDKDEDKTEVHFRENARIHLQQYLEIRELRYKPSIQETSLFLSTKMGEKTGGRMGRRAMQDMVVKYAKAFGKSMSIHKLRHSFATDYNRRNDIYKTKKQLRHSSVDTTERYAMVSRAELAAAIDN